MGSSTCRSCEREIEASFRFCPWCAAAQRQKLVAFFAGHPLRDADNTRALRVSRYLADDAVERHVRVSVWREDGTVEAVISLDDVEASRLASFLEATGPAAPGTGEGPTDATSTVAPGWSAAPPKRP